MTRGEGEAGFEGPPSWSCADVRRCWWAGRAGRAAGSTGAAARAGADDARSGGDERPDDVERSGDDKRPDDDERSDGAGFSGGDERLAGGVTGGRGADRAPSGRSTLSRRPCPAWPARVGPAVSPAGTDEERSRFGPSPGGSELGRVGAGAFAVGASAVGASAAELPAPGPRAAEPSATGLLLAGLLLAGFGAAGATGTTATFDCAMGGGFLAASSVAAAGSSARVRHQAGRSGPRTAARAVGADPARAVLGEGASADVTPAGMALATISGAARGAASVALDGPASGSRARCGASSGRGGEGGSALAAAESLSAAGFLRSAPADDGSLSAGAAPADEEGADRVRAPDNRSAPSSRPPARSAGRTAWARACARSSATRPTALVAAVSRRSESPSSVTPTGPPIAPTPLGRTRFPGPACPGRHVRNTR